MACYDFGLVNASYGLSAHTNMRRSLGFLSLGFWVLGFAALSVGQGAEADVPKPAAGSSLAAVFGDEVKVRRDRFRRDEKRVQAVVPLLGLMDLWEMVADRAPLVAFIEEAAASKVAPPEVVARARFMRALVLDRQGKRDEADKERVRLGVISRFRFIGPFDNEGRAGHAAVLPPERALLGPADGCVAGKEREVCWRELPKIDVQGMVSVETVLRPDTLVTAFLTVAVKSERAEAAALRVGSSGAIKAFVNGQPVLDREVYRGLRFDQEAAGIRLVAGWNRITVKLSAAETGGAQLLLRLTRPDGSPLDGLTVSTQPADLALAHAAPKVAKSSLPKPIDLGEELRRAAKGTDPVVWTDAGLYEHHVIPERPDRRRAVEWLTKAAKLRPTAGAWARVAAAETDPNDQRIALEKGLAVARGAESASLSTSLGEIYDRARRERRASDLWTAALAAQPAYFPAELDLAELAADRGLPTLGLARATALVARFGVAPLRVLKRQAQLAIRAGQRSDAEALERTLAKADAADTEARHELFMAARSRGATAEALGFLDEISRLRPDLLSTYLDRAEILEGQNRLADAETELARVLGIVPDDAKLLEKDGRLLLRLGRDVDAKARYRRSLELVPQNPELRAYLAELDERSHPGASTGSDLVRNWAETPAHLLTLAKPAEAGPARVLLDSSVTRMHANGLSETFHQRTIQILDERGARAETSFDIRYTPDTQSVEVRVARVHRGNEVLEAISTDDEDLSEPWYGLYYDVRGLAVHFSQLKPGDIVDVQYTISDVARRNMFADYFGDLHLLQEELPRVMSRYVILAPKSRILYFNQPVLPSTAKLERKEELHGDERTYSFVARDVPKVEREPGMPGFTEVAAYLHVSTYKTWREVADWYEGLIKAQLEPNAAIDRAVAEAVAKIPKKDERARIRAIYELVVRKTRYVGLEFGIHGYQPYPVSQVFARKFGDCKDKASLLVVMLRQAGIEASLVLARTRRGGDLGPEPASLAPFDHAIAYVPKYDLYLDGTAEFSGADELPAQDQDIPVLRVNDRALMRTPVLPAATNDVRTDWRVTLAPTGAAVVDEKLRISGQAANEWRSHYQAPGERRQRYDQAWNAKHPGAKVESVQMSVESLGKPIELVAQINVPRWAHLEDSGALAMPALGREADMLRNYARLSSRQFDLIVGYPWHQEERVAVRLPSGWSAVRLPEARKLESPFGKFTFAAERRGAEVVVTAALEVTRHRIARADYAAFRAFCAAIDAAVSQELVVSGPAKRAEVTQ